MTSSLSDQMVTRTLYLANKPEEKKAYLSGLVTGATLALKMIEATLKGTWNGDLNSLAGRTYMGAMTFNGLTLGEFMQGIQQGSWGALSMRPEEIAYWELMQAPPTCTQYAYGMDDAIRIVYAEGARHYLRGFLPFTQGAAEIVPWAQTQFDLADSWLKALVVTLG